MEQAPEPPSTFTQLFISSGHRLKIATVEFFEPTGEHGGDAVGGGTGGHNQTTQEVLNSTDGLWKIVIFPSGSQDDARPVALKSLGSSTAWRQEMTPEAAVW